ncbi:long-chain fatty acid--CoA ligase [Caldinitratiruptor microaerophilus]|uniref:Long-chain-fatty-acid--CoA ligase n=1 Tax=Caldinitratiruptor microaerophilus TaxID=671077 RepID=A0AA35CII8_9FIRM|nr:long-chain fatty acid--CoA ligase [Caldinitratiruptor microaerophilus]BDG58978.1 long-chain-fatty-acid--CoA ligase [Caldinitratiruptor microaerophilus]
MEGRMMHFPLTLVHLLERAGQYYPEVRIASRLPDRSVRHTTYGDFYRRSLKFANALRRLGVQKGDRVATLAWNHYRHLEAYFAVPVMGAVYHTLNPRLHPSDLAYIMNHADDRVLLVDDVLLPVFERFRAEVHPRHVIVWSHGQPVPEGFIDYEALIEPEPETFDYPDIDEDQAAGMCYTSGTTGRPKGVVYSHRGIVLHSLVSAMANTLSISQYDAVMPVVPMFHVNAWGLPFTSVLAGARQVFPGPHLDPDSLLDLVQSEKVTITAGVPTVWLGVLERLDREPGKYDTRSLRAIVVGGSAAPQAMIEAYEKRHGLNVVHAWGMTEMTPLGTICTLKPHLLDRPQEERYRYRAMQGRPVPFVEVRAVGDSGPVPWDGRTMGELQVRGPWIASSYFENPGEADKFTPDGWFRTGDIVTIDPEGYVRITDRAKDLIKSGGEWISSVDLENAIMGHPAVKEAAVVAVPHPKWGERPLAVVVLREGAQATADELRAFLEPRFAKWWLPDAFVFTDQIPRTAAGKFLKSALREQYREYRWENA